MSISFLSGIQRGVAVCMLALTVAVLSGCASGPKAPVPRYTQIEVIPVTSPQGVYTQNRLVPLPVLPVLVASSIANRMKSNDFVTHMREPIEALGPELTAMVVEELQAQGQTARPLESLVRNPKNPDKIDYLRLGLPPDRAVLHVVFADVSMDSPRTAGYYLPRVNVDAYFFPELDGSWAHEQHLTYYYGTDADDDKGHGRDIRSDEKYRFPDYDALIVRSDEVREGWRAGLREIARRIARDIHKPGSGG